jgi:hypothetical protein
MCNACPLKAQCTDSDQGRRIHRSFDEAYLDRVRSYHQTERYKKALRKRTVWVEPLFGEAKAWHGLARFRLRRLPKVNIESLLIAAGQNLKRLLSWWGWGRRPYPGGAVGMVLDCLVIFYLICVVWCFGRKILLPHALPGMATREFFNKQGSYGNQAVPSVSLTPGVY